MQSLCKRTVCQSGQFIEGGDKKYWDRERTVWETAVKINVELMRGLHLEYHFYVKTQFEIQNECTILQW